MSTTEHRLSNPPAKTASPGLSERLCQSRGPLWNHQLAHSFVIALGNGSLLRHSLGSDGGITAKNAGEVIQAGATGVAVIPAVVSAEDIAAATRELVTALFEPRRSEEQDKET